MRWKNCTSNPSSVNDREIGYPMILTPPLMRKYSAKAGFVTQNPVSGKQPSCASDARGDGATAESKAARRNPDSTNTRFTQIPPTVWPDDRARPAIDQATGVQ